MAQRRRGSVKPARTVPDIDAKTGEQRIDERTGRPKVKPASGSTWYFAADVGEGGSRKQIKRRGFATKGEAQAALNALMHRAVNKEHVDHTSITYGEWLRTEWLPRIRKEEIAISTWQRYAIDVRVHILPDPISARPLQKLDGSDLDAFWARLRAKPAKNRSSGQTLSRRSVHLIATTVSRSMRDAVQWQQRVDNPTARSKMPTQGRRTEAKAWTADELAGFLQWVRSFVPQSRSERTAAPQLDDPEWRGDRLYPLWHLAATTGMRRGELLALTWDDIHLEPSDRTSCQCRPQPSSPHLVIRGSVRELSGEDLAELGADGLDPRDLARGWQWAPPKTESGHRRISLDELDEHGLPSTVTVLKEWRARQNAERLALGTGWTGVTGPDWTTQRNLVFSTPTGLPLMPGIVSDTFRRRTERFGSGLSIHGLRHTWATLALEAGVSIVVVQKRLGHSRMSTTADIYSHVVEHVDAGAAESVASFIRSQPADSLRQPRVVGVARVEHIRG